MTLRTDVYYRELAQNALRRVGVTEPPVTVEAVAESLGVPMYDTELPAWFSGAIVYIDGMPAILLNAAVGEIGRRRTLGHMVGHILAVLDDPENGYPRHDPDHHVADVVADEMVMPTFMVAEQAKKWFNDYRYLARLFGVTESEIVEKMRAMGLMKNRGMQWDY